MLFPTRRAEKPCERIETEDVCHEKTSRGVDRPLPGGSLVIASRAACGGNFPCAVLKWLLKNMACVVARGFRGFRTRGIDCVLGYPQENKANSQHSRLQSEFPCTPCKFMPELTSGQRLGDYSLCCAMYHVARTASWLREGEEEDWRVEP